MRFKIIFLLILGLFFLNNLSYTYAQSSSKPNADSVKAARAHISDSTLKARKHITDSVQISRKQKTDSIQTARKKITDSTAAARKYRSSRKYTDSVARARNDKTKTLKAARQSKMDSLQESRKYITDSISLARKTRTDSVKAIQKKRTDSIAVVKKYKTSRRYSDSVALSRRERMDSIKTVQKAQRDNIAAIRKKSLDSAKAVRVHMTDSTKAVRTKYTDSLKVVRKARADSLAKKKEAKDKLAKVKEKKKLEAQKLKLELKFKQKKEAWSNKNMLKKSWSPIRRVTQNSFTHYNYYFNANRKMDEAEQNMLRSRKENYDSLIWLYPFNPSKDSSLLASDMDSIIRKVSVGIQIHDPRVKWSNDMYLLLGEAYYYKGGFENASIAFRYIISSDEENKKKNAGKDYYRSKEQPSIINEENGSKLAFLKHKSVHNEAVLWLARTYTQAGQIENAESILSLVEYDPKFPENLKGRLAIEKAFAYLADGNNTEASKHLTIAANDDNLPGWLRLRAAFLNGQLLQNMGDHVAAAESFELVLDHYPKLDMDFYARKYIAYNKLSAGEDVAGAMVPLKKMLNDDKYLTYYDQVYFILGQLAAKAHKDDEAITYLTKSTSTPKATKKQKAQSYAAIGDVYYSTGKYAEAKNAYDSSAKYAGTASKDKSVAVALQRSSGLKEVSGPAQVIRDQDSLLTLAGLSKKEQQAAVRRYLRELEKKRQDSIQNAENAATATAAPEPDMDKSDANSWYFANPTLISQGSTDFKRKWGNRPLRDDWRRSGSGNAIAQNTSTTDDNDEDAGTDKSRNSGDMSEESLLAKIPNTQPQKDAAIKTQQRAYISLAKAYFRQLEDYKQATSTLDTLNARFPNHGQKEEELYLRYQIALKQNNLDKAQGYADELLKKFPESQYALALKPKKTEPKRLIEVGGQNVAAYFDQTYDMILQHQYNEALARIDVGKKQFDHPTYKKRFEVAEAMSYAGIGNFNLADSTISRFIKANPSDSLTAWAKAVQNYIKEVRNGDKPSWYADAVAASDKLAAAKKSGSATAKAEPSKPVVPPTPPPPPPVFRDIPSNYTYNADSEHYCIIILPGLDSRTGILKQNVKNFDDVKYSASNLTLLVDLYDMNQGVLVVKKFANAAAAKTYLNDLKASVALKDYKAGELQLLIITTANYKKLYTDKKVLPYSSFYNSYYQ